MPTPKQMRDRAELIRCWEAFELGQVAPAPLDYLDTAKMLDDAASEIEGLHAGLDMMQKQLSR